MRTTALLMLVACASVIALAGCTTDPDPLVGLAQRIPIALSDEGLLLRRGVSGNERLAADLAIDPEDVRASATAGVPALRVLLVPADRTATALEEAGFTRVESPEGWVVLARTGAGAGFAGVPAVAIGTDVVAVGDAAQLDVLLAGGRPLPVPVGPLDDAEVALVRGAVPATADLPALDAAVVTADREGRGEMALRLDAAGGQAEAVALSVQLRTDGPIDAGGPVLEVGGALTDGDVVTVELTWLVEAEPVLSAGVAASPLGVLDQR